MRGLKSSLSQSIKHITSRIPRGCVDWNMCNGGKLYFPSCRIPRGCVDWNWMCLLFDFLLERRIPRGCVDWNFFILLHNIIYYVASHADAWIEILHPKPAKYKLNVASHADAWIEIILSRVLRCDYLVASHADAWIEITMVARWLNREYCRIPRGCVDWNLALDGGTYQLPPSHPTRMRGLKFPSINYPSLNVSSHPTRMRGLKFEDLFILVGEDKSHPTRMRGLKFVKVLDHLQFLQVASHADAWIEMSRKILFTGNKLCRIPRGCVDWNNRATADTARYITSHPTRMRGLKSCFNWICSFIYGRIPRGCVDWNQVG